MEIDLNELELVRRLRDAEARAAELEADVKSSEEMQTLRFCEMEWATEREACAQIVRSECIGFSPEDDQLNCIVAAIRARSIQPPRVGD